MRSIKEFKKAFVDNISSYYDEREANSIFFLAFEELSSFSKAQFLAKQNEQIPERLAQQLDSIAERLLKREPIQYILKKAYFRNEVYIVNPSVLIPRPETEELVEWILSDVDEKNDIHFLDIGTGSGCIAVELMKERKNWNATAWDISKEALELARTNAAKHGVEIDFIEQDITIANKGTWSLIVSNPPYVPLSEKDRLKPHVLEHEPHKALFSKTEDPLYFYKHIVNYALNSLTGDGLLFLEGHDDHMDELKNLFSTEAWKDVRVRNDINGKPRMLRAKRNG